MNLPVVFRRAVAEEFLEAREWYEAKRGGLGEEFVACVDTAVAVASHNPVLHAKVHGEVRRVLVRRFPYGIFYIVDEATICARDPSIWRDR